MNMYLRLPYFLMDLYELGTENLHLNASVCQTIHNRSSGSNSADQRIDKNLLVFFIFCLQSE